MSTILKEIDFAPATEVTKNFNTTEESGLQAGKLEVNGAGQIVIVNTGGSSASEGGMGSGSDDDTEKGSLSKPGEKSGQASSNDNEDTTFDPLKKSIKEAEKARDKE